MFTDLGPGEHLRREYLLFGLGGAGKTQITLKFAESHRHKQVNVDFFTCLLLLINREEI